MKDSTLEKKIRLDTTYASYALIPVSICKLKPRAQFERHGELFQFKNVRMKPFGTRAQLDYPESNSAT